MPTMVPAIQFYRGDEQCVTDYLNTGAAIANGTAVNMNGLLGIVNTPEGISIGSTTPKLGPVCTCGVWRMRKTAYLGVVFNQGDNVYWDLVAELALRAPAANAVFAGIADEPAVHGHTDVKTRLNEVNPGFTQGNLVTTTSTTTTPAPTTTTTT